METGPRRPLFRSSAKTNDSIRGLLHIAAPGAKRLESETHFLRYRRRGGFGRARDRGPTLRRVFCIAKMRYCRHFLRHLAPRALQRPRHHIQQWVQVPLFYEKTSVFDPSNLKMPLKCMKKKIIITASLGRAETEGNVPFLPRVWSR